MEGLSLDAHVDQDLRRCKARAVLARELLCTLHEALHAVGVDELQRAALEGSEAPAEDRTDIRIGHRAHHALGEALGGLVGLGEQESIDQVRLRQRLGSLELLLEAWPESLGCSLRVL